MKKVLLMLFLSIITLSIKGQEISVESFELNENDMDARIYHPKEDLNGKKAALIKVQTTEKGFTFDLGSLAIIDTEQRVGEIWVYVPAKAKKITIQHPILGVLRDYYFDISIKSATVYILKISTSKIHTIVEEDAGGQYWNLKVIPENAEVCIDEGTTEMVQNGVLNKLLPYGEHTYSISAPLYETTGGRITIGKEKVETDIKLTPAFGYLKLTSTPIEGIDIYIDDKYVGKTPIVTDKLPKGNIKLSAKSQMYNSIDRIIEVPSGADTLVCPITLSPNFAEIEVISEPDVNIYINDQKMGLGKWKDNLTEGLYKIEAKKTAHRSQLKTITVVKNKNQTIHFEKLEPIYGKLNINIGNLDGVKVLIDGIEKGTAPCILSDVLIGTHSIELIKEGYVTYTESITIEEGRLHNIETKMEKQLWADLDITTSPGATILVDGNRSIGNYKGTVKVGKHTISINYFLENILTKEIEVIAGKENKYDFPIEGKLQITSSPSKAVVMINNEFVGNTPVVLDLYGNQELYISKDNYYTRSEKVYVKPTESMSLHYNLTKRPKDLQSFWLYTASPTALYGGMIGFCRVFGWYGKAQIGPSANKNEIDWDATLSEMQYNRLYKEDVNRMSITSGPMLRVAKWLYLYAGAGYGDYGQIYSGMTEDNQYYKYICPVRCKGLEAEGGAIFKMGWVALSCGYSTIFSEVPEGEKQFGDIHIGIGFTINHSK